jgi:hypothetical protein
MSYLNQKDQERPYKGFDLAIQQIQIQIKNELPYIAKVYHRAYLFTEQEGSVRGVKVPKVWEDKREYINVLPNDNQPAMLFFYPTGEEEIKEFDDLDSRNNLFEREVCLILWLNTEKLQNHLTGPSLSKVKSDLLELLSTSDNVVKVSSMEDNDVRKIYREFYIDYKSQYLMLPFAGLRINFTVKFDYISC